MDWIVILALVVGGIALFGAGHINATWLANARAKAKSFGQTVAQDVQKAEVNLQAASGPHGSWGAAIGQAEQAVQAFARNPLDTIERGLASHHASAAVSALETLLKSRLEKAKDLAEHDQVIADLKAKLEALLK